MSISRAVLTSIKSWYAAAKPVSNARRDIQGLRALAVVAVILNHVAQWPVGGFVGVDVFFVISGYLITGLLLREHDKTGTISARGFYARRIKRVVPAAVTVLYVTVLLSVLVLGADRARDVVVDAVWALFFVGNWHSVIQSTDYFQQGQQPSPLQHYWSLGVEEQFYLVWPWLLLLLLVLLGGLLSRRSRGTAGKRVVAGTAIVVLGAASLAWSLYASRHSPDSAYFSSLTRAWELAIGALAAIGAPLAARLPRLLRPVLSYAGLAGIVASLFVVKETAGFPAPWGLLPDVATAVVIIAGEGARVRVWPLTSAVANYLGDISYSLYLWHFPVAIFLESYLIQGSTTYLAVAFPVILVVSILSFHLLEDPIRKSSWLSSWLPAGPGRQRSLQRPRSQRPGYVALGAAVFALVVLGVAATQSTTPPGSPVQASALKRTAGYEPHCYGAIATMQPHDCTSANGEGVYPDPTALRDDHDTAYKCFTQYHTAHFKSCNYGDVRSKFKVAVIGDSHMAQWLAGLNIAARDRGWRVVSFVGQGCSWGNAAACPSWHAMVDKISRGGFDAVVTSDYRKNFGDDSEAAARAASRAWAPLRVPLVVLGDSPEVGKDALSCITRRNVGPDDDCSTPRDEALKTPDPLEIAAKADHKPFVSMNDILCPPAGKTCPAIIGHVLVYRDELSHLSDTFSSTIGTYVLDRVAKALKTAKVKVPAPTGPGG